MSAAEVLPYVIAAVFALLIAAVWIVVCIDDHRREARETERSVW